MRYSIPKMTYPSVIFQLPHVHHTLLPADFEGLDAVPLLAGGAAADPLNVLGAADLAHVHLQKKTLRVHTCSMYRSN